MNARINKRSTQETAPITDFIWYSIPVVAIQSIKFYYASKVEKMCRVTCLTLSATKGQEHWLHAILVRSQKQQIQK
jgi:hypothetical protein